MGIRVRYAIQKMHGGCYTRDAGVYWVQGSTRVLGRKRVPGCGSGDQKLQIQPNHNDTKFEQMQQAIHSHMHASYCMHANLILGIVAVCTDCNTRTASSINKMPSPCREIRILYSSPQQTIRCATRYEANA